MFMSVPFTRVLCHVPTQVLTDLVNGGVMFWADKDEHDALQVGPETAPSPDEQGACASNCSVANIRRESRIMHCAIDKGQYQ